MEVNRHERLEVAKPSIVHIYCVYFGKSERANCPDEEIFWTVFRLTWILCSIRRSVEDVFKLFSLFWKSIFQKGVSSGVQRKREICVQSNSETVIKVRFESSSWAWFEVDFKEIWFDLNNFLASNFDLPEMYDLTEGFGLF